ncbi:transcription factor MYBS1-like [Pyrus x bretschneideri]|uniref:transcription factor MYBS1-like n=1 Tax=Pyrus x bretschneideri TaxID=225117 RepID=UPI00051139A0|nr:transcription factor MYBS1-like [Pyrus x bretschneideri]
MSSSSVWGKEEDKAFENAIAMHWIDENSEEQWEKIADLVPSKSMEELKQHYEMLVDDVGAIEAGRVSPPNYTADEAANTVSSSKDSGHRASSSGASASDKRLNCGQGGGFLGSGHDSASHGGKGGSRADQERKKGIPWTEEEHRLFLLGLDKFGKGDWRSISRNFVISRTPTQVASHAQKYFIRLNSMNRDRRRSSIHDITSVNNGDVSSHQQPPITGQQTSSYAPTAATTIGVGVGPQSVKHRPQPHMTGLGMYGAPMGHPVSAPPGHMASAVGTPVMLPPGHHPHAHPPYAVPVAYPMAHPTMHQ